MKRVKKSVLLWHSARQMHALVTDVNAYPQFLPWCAKAEVVSTHDSGVTARLHIAYAGLTQAFTTRNEHVADRGVSIQLVDGPFTSLDGQWTFTPLPQRGQSDDDAQACRVDFELNYALARGGLEALVSPVFDRIAATFVDAFVKRAEAVHGTP
jgi:ribosome-associated toxin RatA of RatAB toxin-antitoxin module